MKNIYLFAIALIGLSGCSNYQANQSGISLVIDKFTTQAQLEELVNGAKAVNIKLEISDVRYNKKSTIESIHGTVKFPNQGSGTFGSDKLNKIIISQDISSPDSGFSIVVNNKWI